MTIDTPAKLAIIGAGPIGLEAALYARFLGYDVIVIEQGEICEQVRRWGHAKMFTPFRQNSSPLGLRALAAHDEHYEPPEPQALLTGRQWCERYLLPLAETDLLSDHIVTNTKVLGIGKEQVLKTDRESDLPEGDERGDWSFRLLVRDSAGVERIEMVDGVFDCSGVYSQSNFAGHGGLPAVGELALRDQIAYHLPDPLEADRSQYEDQRTLLIGDGLSAAMAAIALDELTQQSPATQFTWITRHEHEPPAGPVASIADDPFPARIQLIEQANEIARAPQRWQWGTHIEQIQRDSSGKFRVILSGQMSGEQTFDRILALVGYRPQLQLHEELQIAVNPVSGGCADTAEPQQLEANYYLLGSNTFGRRSDFLYANGLEQIRAAFAIVGDRPELNLYK